MPDLWYEIAIRVDKDSQESLIASLSDLVSHGFVEEDDTLKCYFNRDEWSDVKRNELDNLLNQLNLTYSYSIKEIENRDWNSLWESTIEPIEATDRIVIKPTWKEYTSDKEKIVITINPKMSFGTGYHETTRLMLCLIQESVKPGDIALDVGTGTGILAIAAVRLGAEKVVGVDCDDWSFQNATENVGLNDAADRVDIRLGGIGDVHESEFDLIFANLTRGAVLKMLMDFRERLKESGTLIVSGLLKEDEKTVQEACTREDFSVLRTLCENEWVALAARKNSRILHGSGRTLKDIRPLC